MRNPITISVKCYISDNWQAPKYTSVAFSQAAITCSKSTIKTVWNLFKVNNRNCEICSNLFTLYSSVSIVNFEHVIADWVFFWLILWACYLFCYAYSIFFTAILNNHDYWKKFRYPSIMMASRAVSPFSDGLKRKIFK